MNTQALESTSAHDLDAGAVERAREVERERLGRSLELWESCSLLWLAVIDQAVEDLKWMRQRSRCTRLTRYERQKMRHILESPPTRFFVSGEFETVCDLLGISWRRVWSSYGLDDLVEGDSPPPISA